MSFGFVVGEGAGVNAKQMPRLWELADLGRRVVAHLSKPDQSGAYLRHAVALEVVTVVRPGCTGR